eukprot:2943336-Amphidinium_carterae.1
MSVQDRLQRQHGFPDDDVPAGQVELHYKTLWFSADIASSVLARTAWCGSTRPLGEQCSVACFVPSLSTACAAFKSSCGIGSQGAFIMAALRSVKIPKHLESSGIFQLHLRAKATLGSAAAKDAVKLPPGVDKNMWIAAQGLEVFEEAASL